MFLRVSDDVYNNLIQDMSGSVKPSAIMMVLVTACGLMVTQRIQTSMSYFVLGYCVAIYAFRIFVILAHRNFIRKFGSDVHVRRWETAHAVANIGVALSIALLNLSTFLADDVEARMATLFITSVFSGGIVGRMSSRPVIAYSMLFTIVVPATIVCLLNSDPFYYYIALANAVALLAALETVRFNYRSAVARIELLHDTEVLARYDPLTGLLNRLGLREAFRAASRTSPALAMHCLDLDGFKPVNDRWGHAAGDEVLKEIARRLQSPELGAYGVARVGGDEFALLQVLDGSEGAAARFAEQARSLIALPIRLPESEVTIGASLGHCEALTGAAMLEDMLKAADMKSYEEKRRKAPAAEAQSEPVRRYR